MSAIARPRRRRCRQSTTSTACASHGEDGASPLRRGPAPAGRVAAVWGTAGDKREELERQRVEDEASAARNGERADGAIDCQERERTSDIGLAHNGIGQDHHGEHRLWTVRRRALGISLVAGDLETVWQRRGEGCEGHCPDGDKRQRAQKRGLSTRVLAAPDSPWSRQSQRRSPRQTRGRQ